jgi:oligopeptide/dipeptide ABC transporter ATP-binding protein
MIFQDPMTSLNPVFTVGDQISEGVRAHLPVSRREARDRALHLLQEVGIPDPVARLDAYPHQLSGGMRQRVMIAIALSAEPEILVADEPTTALDVTVQAQILEVLDRLRASHGMAVLLITHDLGIVAGRADRVAVMYAGQIVEEATTAALFARPSHPYTQGLFASVPRLHGPVERLRPIRGTVPQPSAWPSGCRFRPRCPQAFDKSETMPPLLPLESGHRMRCWLAETERR